NLSCDASANTIVNVNFSDPDGATTGYIKTTKASNGATNQSAPAGSPQSFILPASWYDPGGGQTVTLWVTDVGASGTGIRQVASTTTPNCITLNCGSAVASPLRLDPATQFAVTVTATSSAAAGNGTMQLNIPSVPGGTASQSVAPSGTTYTTTF